MTEKPNPSTYNATNPTMHTFPMQLNLLDKLDSYTDMAHLNKLETDWSYHFAMFLLKGSEEQLSFRADFSLHAQFNRYYFAQQSALVQQGRGNFALGFPMVFVELEEEVVLSPLVIWELALEPHPTKAQSWQISQAPHQRRFFNRQLKRLLSPEQWEKSAPIVEKLERKSENSAEALVDFCSQFAKDAGLDLREEAITLSPLPTLADVDQERMNKLIHWSGLFGLYPLADYWFEHTDKLSSPKVEKDTTEKHWPIGINVLDNWQAAAFQGMLNKKDTLISGKEGTGKTFLLAHLLSNLLLHHRKTLIVSSQVDDLALLFETLQEKGMAPFSFLIPEAPKAMSKLQEQINILYKPTKTPKPTLDKTFEPALEEWQKAKDKLDQFYRASRGRTFGSFNRIEVLAFLLRSSRTEGKELLASQLDAKDFSFSPSEMEQLAEAIEKSEPLFDQIRTLSHPLNNLNAGIFLHKNEEEAFEFIQQTSKKFLDKATQLQYDFIRQLNGYSDQLLSWHDDAYRTLKQNLEHLQERLGAYLKSFSKDTLESAKTTLKLYGALSDRFQKALEAQEDIQLLYTRLEEQSTHYSFFAHAFLEGRERKKMDVLQSNLQTFGEALANWRANLNEAILEDVNRLNSKTVHAQVDIKEHVLSMEAQFDLFVDELNASGIYQLPLQGKMLTFPKRQRFLQDCIEQLELTRINLRDFNLFYAWQKHWFLLPALARRIVTALVKVRPQSWLAAFESWYFEQCLNQSHTSLAALPEDSLTHFAAMDQKLRDKVIGEALNRAAIQRQEGLKQLKNSGKTWQDWLKTPSPSFEQLLQICDQQLDVLTRIFPIVLATPTEANILMEKSTHQFDYVIAWENRGLKADLKGSLRKLGKKWVSFSNPEQQLQSTQHDEVYPLNGVYWRSPLDPLAEVDKTQQSIAIHCEWINGRFDEETEKNEEEAQAILQRLNKVEVLPDGRFPSLGLVCLTEGQRNLLLEYIQQIKQQELPGVERIKQLEDSGLRVLTLNELSGYQYDIVMVSVTFGKLSVKGKLSTKVQSLNQPSTIAGLQQLKNIAAHQWQLFHSIPEKEWNNWLETPGLKGQQLLASYIQRAVLLSDGQGFAPKIREEASTDKTSFAQEIAWRVAPYLSTNRLRLDQPWMGVALPLVILPAQSHLAPQLFIIDGFLSQSGATDYAWEYHQQQTLQDNGYRLRSLSTYNWWKNPANEADKLLQLIRGLDQPPPLEEE
ncbi:MAG: hypothetical protein R2828_32690 [Saprospiraceae bacterium]